MKAGISKHSFSGTIYKVGINPCVKVPARVSKKFNPQKGYIYVKGTINGHPFTQTLVPVKEEGYRLYVNAPMLKGGNTAIGKRARFIIESDDAPPTRNIPQHKGLTAALKEHDLTEKFRGLPPSRRKEINRYLNNLKSPDAVERNIKKVVKGLKGEMTVSLFRLGADPK